MLICKIKVKHLNLLKEKSETLESIVIEQQSYMGKWFRVFDNLNASY